MFDLMPFEHKTRNIANFFDTFEKTFFNDFPAGFSEIRTDILDKGDRYVLQAELPGFDKQDIKIDLNGETSEDKDGYVRRERRYGSFARSFDVSNINTEAIKAAYNNGVLELDLPKRTPAQSQTRQIELQ